MENVAFGLRKTCDDRNDDSSFVFSNIVFGAGICVFEEIIFFYYAVDSKMRVRIFREYLHSSGTYITYMFSHNSELEKLASDWFLSVRPTRTLSMNSTRNLMALLRAFELERNIFFFYNSQRNKIFGL